MMSRDSENWRREILEILDAARDNRGDWMAALEFVADDLAVAGHANESDRLLEALEVVRQGGRADWLASIESVADDLA